ncbi:hypothetical protein MD484_g8974, partial [Candolleomyces efflorescens]
MSPSRARAKSPPAATKPVRRSARARASAPPSEAEPVAPPPAPKKKETKVKPRPRNKGKKPAAAFDVEQVAPATPPARPSPPLLPAVVGETTTDSVLDPQYQVLSYEAASVYATIAPKSLFLENAESALMLTTPAHSRELPKFPCRGRVCLEKPSGCVPYDGKSDKCHPCQHSHDFCSFQRPLNDTPLHDHLRGFWDMAQGPRSTVYVNNLHNQLRREWEHLRDLTILTNHQAARVESTRRFISSYIQTARMDSPEFVDEGMVTGVSSDRGFESSTTT